MFGNATIAPTVGNLTFCKHIAADILAIPVRDLAPEKRIEKFADKYKSLPKREHDALVKRLYRGLDIVEAGGVTRLEDGSAEVASSMGGAYHVHNHICSCQDWLKGYSEHIHRLAALDLLPNPPVE